MSESSFQGKTASIREPQEANLVRPIICTPLLFFIVLLVGCNSGPEVRAPGRDVSPSEKTSDGWVPQKTWSLVEMSPGFWFTLNTAMWGESGVKWQFVNALTVDGDPISFRCDGEFPSKIRGVSSSGGSSAVASLTMFTLVVKGSTRTRYELTYPVRGD